MKLKIAAISDTHGRHEDIEMPDTDVVIHCGDSCTRGSKNEMYAFLDWYESLPIPYKLLTFGNHDRWAYDYFLVVMCACRVRNITTLIDSAIEIEGLNFFGAPWSRKFGWTKAFMYDPADEHIIWKGLRDYPNKIDVLITHSPPFGILDQCPQSVGSDELGEIVKVIKPRYHLVGHIHTRAGGIVHKQYPDGSETYFVNCASVDDSYKITKNPVFTFELSV